MLHYLDTILHTITKKIEIFFSLLLQFGLTKKLQISPLETASIKIKKIYNTDSRGQHFGAAYMKTRCFQRCLRMCPGSILLQSLLIGPEYPFTSSERPSLKRGKTPAGR